MTQRIYNLDWYASNESVKYPLDSLASCIPTGYDYVPQELLGVITDISFNIPYSIESQPYLASLSITDDLITLIICAGSTPLFAFSSTQSSLVVNRYYDLTSFATSCSGVIVFGESAKTHRCSYKFASATEGGFLPSVYHRYIDYPVVSIGKKDGASAYQKDIFFKGEGDVKVTSEVITIKTQIYDTNGGISFVHGISSEMIVFSLDTSEETMQKYLGPCDVRPESGTCSRSSIEKINALIPDESGNISIRGDGINVDTVEGHLLLSTSYTLDDICVKDKFHNLIGLDTCCDTCLPRDDESIAGCSNGKVRYINFNNDILGSGIEIDYRGVTALENSVSLTIDKLKNLDYFTITVLRPVGSGWCSIDWGGDYSARVSSEAVTWGDDNIPLLDEESEVYPRTITITIDHCSGKQLVIADNKVLVSENLTPPFGDMDVSISFGIGCSITKIGYIRDDFIIGGRDYPFLNRPLLSFTGIGEGVVRFKHPMKVCHLATAIKVDAEGNMIYYPECFPIFKSTITQIGTADFPYMGDTDSMSIDWNSIHRHWWFGCAGHRYKVSTVYSCRDKTWYAYENAYQRFNTGPFIITSTTFTHGTYILAEPEEGEQAYGTF